jgi:hypothetical protein
MVYLTFLIALQLSRNWYQAYIDINILVTILRPQKEVPRIAETMAFKASSFTPNILHFLISFSYHCNNNNPPVVFSSSLLWFPPAQSACH